MTDDVTVPAETLRQLMQDIFEASKVPEHERTSLAGILDRVVDGHGRHQPCDSSCPCVE